MVGKPSTPEKSPVNQTGFGPLARTINSEPSRLLLFVLSGGPRKVSETRHTLTQRAVRLQVSDTSLPR